MRKRNIVVAFLAAGAALIGLVMYSVQKDQALQVTIEQDWSPQRLAACMGLYVSIYDRDATNYGWQPGSDRWQCHQEPKSSGQMKDAGHKWIWQEGARGGVHTHLTAIVRPLPSGALTFNKFSI
jgi:hypothetical protein